MYMPLTLKIKKDYFIDELRASGVSVEYWDIAQLFFKKLQLPDQIELPYVRHVKSLKEFDAAIAKEDSKQLEIIAQFSLYNVLGLRLARILTKYRFRLYYFDVPGLPFDTVGGKNKKSYFKIITLSKVIDYLLIKLPNILKRMNLIKGYDVVFAAGENAANRYGALTKIVKINHYDYDRYLSSKDSSNRLVKGDYAVFIDEYLPYHPDNEILRLPQINPQKYYQNINNFFGIVEKKYGLQVVIAADPKSNYADSDIYNGRRMFKYKTNELIKYSKFVMAHMSSAVSYAVIYNKPVLFIYTNEYKKAYPNTMFCVLLHIANVLNSKAINVEEVTTGDNLEMSEVNRQRYCNYLYGYLTSRESESRLTKDIVLKNLEGVL